MGKAEKFIEDYTNHYSNELCAVEDRFGEKVISYHEWLTPDQARRAVEIEREELIEKAVEWFKKYLQGIAGGSIYIEDFKNYMKEK